MADEILCELCYHKCNACDKNDGANFIYALEQCDHSFCFECLRQYLKYQIIESRVAISCPKCSEKMHPNEVYNILSHRNNEPRTPSSKTESPLGRQISVELSSSSSSSSCEENTAPVSDAGLVSCPSPKATDALLEGVKSTRKWSSTKSTKQQQVNVKREPANGDQLNEAAANPTVGVVNNEYTQLIRKYEEFMIRRVLVTMPDTRWCPAPDCTYAVIATGCANCPQLFCLRPGCGTSFCYHCKQHWHPNMTCEEAAFRSSSLSAQAAVNLLASMQGLVSGSNTTTGTAAEAGAATATAPPAANASSTNKLIRSLLERSNSHISTTSSNFAINMASGTGATVSSARASGGGGITGGDWCKEEIKRCPKCLSMFFQLCF
jgi:hypothetical protein